MAGAIVGTGKPDGAAVGGGWVRVGGRVVGSRIHDSHFGRTGVVPRQPISATR